MFPFGQNLDPDIAISRSVIAHGAIFGLAGLLAVSVLAWIYRRRFPLASYGWFVFLILLAPTSSFVPIRDPMAERRMYLPFIGLLFDHRGISAALESVAETCWSARSRWFWWWKARSHINEICCGAARSTSGKTPSPNLPGNCGRASNWRTPNFKRRPAPTRWTNSEEPRRSSRRHWDLLLDWALAYDCAGNSQQAIAKFQQAAAQHPNGYTYSQIGMEYGKIGKYPEALEALATAQRLDPSFAMTYDYLGNIHAIQGNQAQAVADYQHVLALDPHNAPAREALARMGR